MFGVVQQAAGHNLSVLPVLLALAFMFALLQQVGSCNQLFVVVDPHTWNCY